MKKQYQCLYKDISCDKLDSLSLTKIQCIDCNHYDKGVRYSKGFFLPNMKKLLLKLLVIILTLLAILLILWVFATD